MAKALGAPVDVVCVPSALAGQDWPPRVDAQKVAADTGSRLQSRGLSVRTHVPEGDAALALVALAEDQGAQMIVMGNKGMTGMRRLVGSLPNRVSHQARCDVLIIPTESPSLAEFTGGSIVVGTDGSGRASGAVKKAIQLAKALGGDLHIVSRSKLSESPEAALSVAAGMAAAEGVTANTYVRHGDTADALIEVAQKNDAAIIIVGGKGMRAEERDWFGNVPDRLSHQGAASVLIVFTEDGGDDASVEAEEAVPAGEEAAS